MRRLKWDGILTGLVLVRIGQELGSDTRLARAVHDLLAAVLAVVK